MKEVSYPGMPAPKEIIGKKSLMGTLGKAEAEEMFGELLNLSLERNQWVAPTVKEFGKVLDDKLEAVRKNYEARLRNAEKRRAYEKKKRWLRLIGKKPEKPQYEKVSNMYSIMDVVPDAPVIGMRFMMDRGFVEILDDSNEKATYFVLTEKALNTLK